MLRLSIIQLKYTTLRQMYVPIKLEEKQLWWFGHKLDAYKTDTRMGIRNGVGVGERHADPQRNGSAK